MRTTFENHWGRQANHNFKRTNFKRVNESWSQATDPNGHRGIRDRFLDAIPWKEADDAEGMLYRTKINTEELSATGPLDGCATSAFAWNKNILSTLWRRKPDGRGTTMTPQPTDPQREETPKPQNCVKRRRNTPSGVVVLKSGAAATDDWEMRRHKGPPVFVLQKKRYRRPPLAKQRLRPLRLQCPSGRKSSQGAVAERRFEKVAGGRRWRERRSHVNGVASQMSSTEKTEQQWWK